MMQQRTHRSDPYTAEQVWRVLCRSARARLSAALYRACFSGTTGIELTANRLLVQVPTLTVKQLMEDRFRPLLQATALPLLGESGRIEFALPDALPTTPPANHSLTRPPIGSRLRPELTFASFVVGDANRFAFAAAQSVAESPGLQYNPLFIYGGVGLGKTHLLMAIGNEAEAHGLRVCYVTSETFTNEIIAAIRDATQEAFRARYRAIDILLVDDIQFIGGRERTEEEFFHTFNALHGYNKQIVVTSDRPPRDIPTLHARLRSRFEWGLLADVRTPDYDHRLAILQAKAAHSPVPIPQIALEYLARPDNASVRTLEGALNYLIAQMQLHRKQPTLQLVGTVLRECLDVTGPLDLLPQTVLEVVARAYQVDIGDLLGKSRSRHLVWPRQVAMYLLREETRISLAQIGAALGGRDHTTIMHGCDHIAEHYQHNERIRREIDAVRDQLRML